MQTIHLEFTLTEVNLILDALGQKPFSEVYQLINKIQSQAAGQLDNNGPAEQTAGQSKEP